MSGVAALVTSMVSKNAPGILLVRKFRPIPPELAILLPSMVTELSVWLVPRTMTSLTTPSPFSEPAIPGRRIRSSPASLFERFPYASSATTLFTLAALRWAVSAAALPSRSPTTLNLSSR